MKENPYYKAWEKATTQGFDSAPMTYFDTRRRLTRKYSFPVPTGEAIDTIASKSPVVELGAGAGYWAKLIKAAGGQIEAWDCTPWNKSAYGFTKLWFPVQRGGVAVLKRTSAKTLFLSWPCYDRPFAYKALEAFRGETFIYIGESRGGCCGNNRFFDTLQRVWEPEKTLNLPNWLGIHDRFELYRRK